MEKIWAQKRLRTRAALLAAARDLVREKGYARTTLQETAARAGMTIGAIYGNFENRDALFLALGELHWPPIVSKSPPDATFAEHMRALAEAALAAVPERQVVVVGRLTGLAYALSHEAMRERVRDVTALHYQIGAEWLASLGEARDLPVPAATLVRVIHALLEGLVLQRLLTPELVGDEVFYEAFGALARAGGRDGGPCACVSGKTFEPRSGGTARRSLSAPPCRSLALRPPALGWSAAARRPARQRPQNGPRRRLSGGDRAQRHGLPTARRPRRPATASRPCPPTRHRRGLLATPARHHLRPPAVPC